MEEINKKIENSIQSMLFFIKQLKGNRYVLIFKRVVFNKRFSRTFE